ncbi:MAG: sodium:calcium antiporter [Nanoarchaeota archaeon]|nr:sodium:calcium antiporter [Nanoarchaeota archaeon]
MNPLLFYIIIAIACVYLISKSADYAIHAVIDYAKKTGVSEYVVGFLIVALGTSLPELSTGIMAATADKNALILGDLIGACIIVVAVVLGIMVVISRKIEIKEKSHYKSFLVWVLIILPVLLAADSRISRIDGFILLAAYVVYLVIMWIKEGKESKLKHDVKFKKIWQNIVVFGGCMAALLLFARWLVVSLVNIGDILHIPLYFMGLIFLSIGTTVPELVVEIKSTLKGHAKIAFGTTFGSCVTNLTLILGIVALIRPVNIIIGDFLFSAIMMVSIITLGIIFFSFKRITWPQGVLLLATYAAFVIGTVLLR